MNSSSVYCPLSENLLQTVVAAEARDTSILIFPTESSKSEALRIHRQNWQFEDVLFLTMSEWKGMLFFSEIPLLTEEKRLLLLNQAMSPTFRKQFHFTSYFQTVEFCNRFFDLFEELADEAIEPETMLSRLPDHTLDLQDWQMDMYQSLLELRTDYRHLLEERHFTDRIFTHAMSHFRDEFLQPYHRLIFVNQYYYTQLEREIIARCEQRGLEVVRYHQMPEAVSTKQEWSLEDLGCSHVRQIRYRQCKNKFGMIHSFLHMLDTIPQERPGVIIDPNAMSQSYAAWLSPTYFVLPERDKIWNTTLFRFWETCDTLINGIIIDPETRLHLIPLKLVTEATFLSDFSRCFLEDESMLPMVQGDLADWSLKDILYLDVELELLHHLPPTWMRQVTSVYLTKLFAYVRRLLSIRTFSELIAFIHEPDGIPIRHILSEEEFTSSSVETIFYEALRHLQSAETLGIVEDWSVLFGTGENTVAGGILHILMEHLKQKRVRFEFDREYDKRIRFLDLLDSRNIQFQQIAIFQASEGLIPTSRKTPWLFSEPQRSKLGLKTYEDVRNRERYYFYRTLLNAGNVWLFSYENEEEGLEKSSFVEELMLSYPQLFIDRQVVPDAGYKQHIATIYPAQPGWEVPDRRKVSSDFFHIPFDPEHDLEENYFILDYTYYRDLLSNPFAAVIQHSLRQDDTAPGEELSLTEKMIGNIAHFFYSSLWTDIREKHAAGTLQLNLITNEWSDSFLQKHAVHLLTSPSLLYFRLPHNYSDLFFREIMLPQMVEGVPAFLTLLAERYELQDIDPIPETEKRSSQEKSHRILIPCREPQVPIGIKVFGRSDLRLEDLARNKVVIIDFKTAQDDTFLKKNPEQLLFYELFYYGFPDVDHHRNINSLFYLVFQNRCVPLDSQSDRNAMIQDLLDKMSALVRDLMLNGYHLPSLKKDQNRHADITRIDLRRILRRESHEAE